MPPPPPPSSLAFTLLLLLLLLPLLLLPLTAAYLLGNYATIPARYRRTTPTEGKSLYVLVAMSTSPQANHLAVMQILAAVVMHWAWWRTVYLHRLPCVYAGLAGPAFRCSTSSNSGLVNIHYTRGDTDAAFLFPFFARAPYILHAHRSCGTHRS